MGSIIGASRTDARSRRTTFRYDEHMSIKSRASLLPLAALVMMGLLATEAAYDPAARRLLQPLRRPLFALQTPGRWEARAPMPTSRSEVAAAEVGGKVYVVGGLVETGLTGALEAYDPAADTWQVLAPLPEPAHHPSAASLAGKLYVFGGYVRDWE